MKTIKQILVDARKLLASPEHWTKGSFARDKNNQPTDVFGERAVCFCTMGAILRAAGEGHDHGSDWPGIPAALALEQANGLTAIARYNDCNKITHANILQLFDKAIAAQGE